MVVVPPPPVVVVPLVVVVVGVGATAVRTAAVVGASVTEVTIAPPAVR